MPTIDIFCLSAGYYICSCYRLIGVACNERNNKLFIEISPFVNGWTNQNTTKECKLLPLLFLPRRGVHQEAAGLNCGSGCWLRCVVLFFNSQCNLTPRWHYSTCGQCKVLNRMPQESPKQGLFQTLDTMSIFLHSIFETNRAWTPSPLWTNFVSKKTLVITDGP